MKKCAFLNYLGTILEERQQQYGDPKQQMKTIAARWSLTLKTPITPEQVALCMIDLKLVRLIHSPRHLDSIIDIAGYAACLAELASSYKD